MINPLIQAHCVCAVTYVLQNVVALVGEMLTIYIYFNTFLIYMNYNDIN